MAQENLNTSSPNDGFGDALRAAFIKVQNMFTDLYTNKVDKQLGKDLSANDFTSVLKNKLDNIASFAEVNVQADFNQADDTQDDFIKNKPVIQNVDNFVLNGGYSGTAQDLANLVIVDGLTSGGEIDVTDFATGVLKVGFSSWKFLTLQYLTSSITTFTGIGLSSPGNQRFVAFYGTNLNTIIKAEGTESAAAVLPNAPANSVLLSYVLITDAVVNAPVVDLSGFVTTNTEQDITSKKRFLADTSIDQALVGALRLTDLYNGNPNTQIARVGSVTQGSKDISFTRIPSFLVDLLWGENGVFNFRLRPQVNGSDIALKLEVDANTTALGNKADLVNGTVPANQLPSFVDDVLEFADLASFPATGENAKIYIALDTNITYRWGGSSYVTIGSSLALGETAQTAYRGDRGKIAYDHSQDVTTNPHAVTKAQVGLGNLQNTDLTSDVVANTAKRSYPSADETKLAGITGTNTGDNIFATDAELQTQTTPTEDNKVVRRRGLISWFNWLKTQVVNVTERWQFLGIGIGTAGVANAWLVLAASTSAIASFIVTFGASYTGTVEGSIWGETIGKRIKIYRNGVADDFLFKNANASLVDAVPLSALTKNAAGDISSLETKDAFVRIATAVNYTVVFATVGFGALIGVTSTAAARTITLPLASTYPAGVPLRVKDESGAAGTNNITITRVGSDVIDGATTSVISTNYGGRHIYSDGVDKWFLI